MENEPAQAKRIFIGDRVQTPAGVGYVEEVTTWRDRVIEMRQVALKAFNEKCRRESGPDFRTRWASVLVRIGDRHHTFLRQQITVEESRDERKSGTL